jgi:phosphoglycerate dehydrogenase-like enzyme
VTHSPIIVVHGAASADDVPNLAPLCAQYDFRYAPDGASLAKALPGADVLLGWNFAAREFSECWPHAKALRWIHWCGAGVDAVLTPEVRSSEIVLTNVRGLFDSAMAEYTLGLILAFAKDLPVTLQAQRDKQWSYRLTESIAGKKVLVIGTGSIGRTIARLLRAAGMMVDGVSRTARESDPDFNAVTSVADLDDVLPGADYVVLITPLTENTRGLFNANRFARMAPHARFLNLGRGALVIEEDLINALRNKVIAGAALDVFEQEPLPEASALWAIPNVIVSPHMSGDYIGFEEAMVERFRINLQRYVNDEPLQNIVDKQAGFAAQSSPG